MAGCSSGLRPADAARRRGRQDSPAATHAWRAPPATFRWRRQAVARAARDDPARSQPRDHRAAASEASCSNEVAPPHGVVAGRKCARPRLAPYSRRRALRGREPTPYSQTRMNVPHVVIIGGGFAGLSAVRTLRKAAVSITLIDRRNHHLFQPLLYQVATAALNPADIAYPIRGVLATQANARVLLAEVKSIDVSAH